MANGTPDAVEKAAEESDRLLDEMMGGGEPPVEEPEEQPSDTSAPAVPPVDDETQKLREALEREKHRNDSLQGRLESQLRPMNEMVRSLQSEIAYLRGRQDAAVARPPEPEKPAPLRHVKPEEVEAVGKETIDLQARVARGVAEEELSRLRSEAEAKQRSIDARLRELEKSKADSSLSALWARVDQVSPGAAAANASDSAWFAFLDQPDKYSGRLRREIGEAAVAVGDVRRLAMLFDEYKAEAGIVSPVDSRPVPPDVKPETVKATPTGSATPTSAKVMLKESDVKRFYSDYARGVYRGREDEAKRMESRIEQAVIEGRVTPG